MIDMENKCLYCYRELKKGEAGYHASCAFKLFGSTKAPVMPYSRNNIGDLALEILKSRTSVTGVQPKLSLDINKGAKNEPDRLTIVGLWGNYILKPQSPKFNSLPELEDLTMNNQNRNQNNNQNQNSNQNQNNNQKNNQKSNQNQNQNKR